MKFIPPTMLFLGNVIPTGYLQHDVIDDVMLPIQSAMNRWIKTRHITADYAEAFKELTDNASKPKNCHPEVSVSKVQRDEKDVDKFLTFVSNVQNSFD